MFKSVKPFEFVLVVVFCLCGIVFSPLVSPLAADFLNADFVTREFATRSPYAISIPHESGPYDSVYVAAGKQVKDISCRVHDSSTICEDQENTVTIELNLFNSTGIVTHLGETRKMVCGLSINPVSKICAISQNP